MSQRRHRRLSPASVAALVAAALIVLAAAISPSQAVARSCGGVRFPDTADVDGTPLVLNGLGIREATILNVDVYVAALYVEQRGRRAADVLHLDRKIRLVLRFVRDVGRDEMNDGVREGFSRQNAGPALAPNIRRLAGWVPELHTGNVLTFTWRPGVGLEMKVGQTIKGVLVGEDFARAFFSIWLGAHPPNEGLRAGLLGGSCG